MTRQVPGRNCWCSPVSLCKQHCWGCCDLAVAVYQHIKTIHHVIFTSSFIRHSRVRAVLAVQAAVIVSTKNSTGWIRRSTAALCVQLHRQQNKPHFQIETARIRPRCGKPNVSPTGVQVSPAHLERRSSSSKVFRFTLTEHSTARRPPHGSLVWSGSIKTG